MIKVYTHTHTHAHTQVILLWWNIANWFSDNLTASHAQDEIKSFLWPLSRYIICPHAMLSSHVHSSPNTPHSNHMYVFRISPTCLGSMCNITCASAVRSAWNIPSDGHVTGPFPSLKCLHRCCFLKKAFPIIFILLSLYYFVSVSS